MKSTGIVNMCALMALLIIGSNSGSHLAAAAIANQGKVATTTDTRGTNNSVNMSEIKSKSLTCPPGNFYDPHSGKCRPMLLPPPPPHCPDGNFYDPHSKICRPIVHIPF